MKVKQVRNLIVDFIRNKKIKNIKGYELGLSGGIDSAVVLALTCEAVGAENVHCQMLPYYENENLDDAIKLAKEFNVSYTVNSIKKAHDVMCEGQSWTKQAKENLMARIRMCYLYSTANTYGRLVLGTCNLSEIMVGYFTKWGDGAADIEPLGRVLKKHVYEIARDWNESHPDGPCIPQQILTKKPSADLYPGQTDEDDLGSYEILDGYLMYLYEQKVFMLPDENYKRISNLIVNSQHKRNPIPFPNIPNNFIVENTKSDKLTPDKAIEILRESISL